jgi:hypothetical protein
MIHQNIAFIEAKMHALRDTQQDLENRVEDLYANRHEYPIWPLHNEGLDYFEQEYHGPVRHVYYSSAISLIRFLRELRKVTKHGHNS